MKKVVYLAPIFLLSFLGKNALAGQVEHVSNLDSALEQASAINNSTADTNKNTTVLQNQVLRINKTNQTAIPDSIKQSTGFQDKKIAANTNVTINNPANNRIHVNWVDANGQNINANGYDIDLTTIQNNSDSEYHWLPKGYQLHNPNGKYHVIYNKNTIPHAAITHQEHEKYTGTVDWGHNDAYDDWHDETYDNQHAKINWSDGSSCTARGKYYYHTWTSSRNWSGDTKGLSKSTLNFIVSETLNIHGFHANQSAHGVPFSYTTKTGPTKTIVDRPAYNSTVYSDVQFADNSGNVKSYSGNTVDVILQHQTKRIDPNNSSLDLDANNQLHLINTSQEQPKQSTTNFKVGYLLDLVTNNKIIDTNNAQALNNTKIFTVNPSLPIGYDALNTKLLTLNL